MADIPVTQNECLSDEEKLLYNIWQSLIGGTLIPGQPSARYPLGWDVDSVIRQLLYNIMLNVGGGVGGGTVTSVQVDSNSLANGTTPNPIVGAGTVNLELQIIDISVAAAQALEAANGMLPDVTYRLTDLDWPLKNSTLDTACFNTVKSDSGLPRLSRHGIAYSDSGYQYQIVFDLQKDTLCEWFLADFNQRAGRTLMSGKNCIETAPNEDANCQNFWIYETDLNNLTAGNPNNLQSCKIFDSTIDFNGLGGDIFGGTVINHAAVTLDSDDSFLDGCIVMPYAVLQIGHNCNKCIFEPGSTVTVSNPNPISNMRFGSNTNIVINSPVTNKSLDTGLNELQKFVPVNGGTDLIADSFATNIGVNLDGGVIVAAYSLSMPAITYDGQVVSISTLHEISVFTIVGNGNAIDYPLAAKLQAGEGLMFIFENATSTWRLIL